MARLSLRPALLVLAMAPLAAGCSAGDGDGPLGTAQEASVCAAGAVVKGVDVSVYQGNVDWPTVKAAGIDFAIARISDGTYMDTKFDQNWSGIKNAGMVRGAYQFFEPGGDPVQQANIVIQKVGTLGVGDLPVTLDVEVSGGQSAATVVSHIQTWVDHVTAGTGKTPMIYTSPGLWSSLTGGSTAFGNLPLWVANWGVTCPSMPSGWSNWAFWQNSDSGHVNGIPATVDLDEYNGDLGALQKFAGQAPDWGAKYVDQSWPFATMTMTMTVNQVLPASITLKNVGQKSWDGNTHLGTTQPRDRMSPFAGSDWLAPNRPAGVPQGMTVAPGNDFKFAFSFHAPDKPGMFDEFYSVVEDGVAWFGDPGQGGPADNVIEAKIQVVEAEYHGVFSKQSYPTLQDPPIQMTVGQSLDGWIELTNAGTATWKAGETKLAPTPRDMTSPLAGTTWLSPTRVSTLDADVPPGGTGHFKLELRANKAGDFTQTFTLVEEGVTWFADAPKGGGPADDQLAVHVVVSDKTSGGTGGSGAGGGGAGGEGGGGVHVGVAGQAKCGCLVAGEPAGRDGAAWLAAAGAIVLMRRRRRA
jgi:lysozyme